MSDLVSEWLAANYPELNIQDATRLRLIELVGSEYSYLALPDLWSVYFTQNGYTGAQADQFFKMFEATGIDQQLRNPFYAISGVGEVVSDFANVVLLLHGDGTNGSTTITDVTGKTITANGTATIQTDFPLFGTGALDMTGTTSSYFSTPASADFDFGTGDFCIELAARFDVHTATTTLIGNYAGSGSGWTVQYRTDTGGLRFGNGDTSLIDRSFTPTDGVYYRLCVSRSGTDLRLFVDGTQLGAAISNTTDIASGAALHIGRLNFGTGTQPYNGRMDEVRITKGLARRTGNYTPDASAFPDS